MMEVLLEEMEARERMEVGSLEDGRKPYRGYAFWWS